MSITFKAAALTSAVSIALTSNLVLAAEQTKPSITLDPIVVTATRSAQNTNEIPARITIIEPQIIDQSPIASLPDLLKTEAAINMVQLGGYGQQSSIFLRGTNSNQTLVLRDGVRLNTATTGAASLPFIDTTDIKQIEILKGPASVLYGTDAIGGVVQLISKTPEKTSAFITGEYGENSTYKSLIGADIAENGVYAQIRGQRLETDGTPISESSTAQPAAFDQKGYSAKVGIDKESFAASLDFSENEGNSEYENFGTMTNQDFKNQIINLKGQVKLNQVVELNARVSQFKDEIIQKDQNWMGTFDFVDSTTKEAELYSKLQLNQQNIILVGATHRITDADAIVGGNAFDEEVDSTGYYIQHQYNQNGLNTQVGVRVEDNERFGTHTVAQGAIRYQILPLTSIYANIGTAFKAPTLNDMYAFGGNPDLNPEESISYEIGFDQKLNYNISTGLSAYTTKVDNLISYECVAVCDGDWVNTFPISQNINIKEATLEGAELYIKWQGENLFLNLGYNYVRAKDDNTEEDLSRRPRQNASLTAGWADESVGISTTITSISKSDNSAFDTMQIPGHSRIDLHGFYNVNNYIKLFTNIQNVGDSKYRTAFGSGNYYINGGRQASVGVTLRY